MTNKGIVEAPRTAKMIILKGEGTFHSNITKITKEAITATKKGKMCQALITVQELFFITKLGFAFGL